MISALGRQIGVARRSAVAGSLRTFSTQPQQFQQHADNITRKNLTTVSSKVQDWKDDMEDYDSNIPYYVDQHITMITPTTISSEVQNWKDDMEDYDSSIHYYVDQPNKPTMTSVLKGIERQSCHKDLDHHSRQILKQHLEDAFLRRHAWE